MASKIQRIISMISSAALASACLGSTCIYAETESTVFPYTAECETLEGAELWTSIYETQLPGYSGEGFAYLTANDISLSVTVPEDDMYEIVVSYCEILNEEGREQTISINGADFMYKFPYADTWTEYSFGVHRLKKGENTLVLKPRYGYAAFDTITVKKAELPELNIAPVLCDKKATPETQSLMNYLCDVYGNNIISGQQEIYGGGNDGNMELEFDWLYEKTGKYPAIRGFDLMNYNPLYGWDDESVERAIDWVNEKGGIATASWHINVPQDFDSYKLGDAVDWQQCTYKPTPSFDTSKAIIDGTKENEYLKLAIADLAEQIGRLQDAGVPLIFRPFHEAEGNGGLDGSGAWFWWSSAGAETYKELWKILYNALTEEYGLHNIIWEENLYTWSTESAQWYVGDEYVDMVGYDKYNTVYNRNDGLSNCPNEDAISSVFYDLVKFTNNKKLVAMPENDTIPTVDNLLVEKAGWLYFCPWYGEYLMDEKYNYTDSVIDIYKSDYVITLDELPDLKAYKYKGTAPITPPETSETTKDTTADSTELSTDSSKPVETTTTNNTEPSETSVSSDENTSFTSDSVNSDTSAPEMQATLLGDANNDGSIDIRDVSLLAQYLVHLKKLSDEGLVNADVTKDGVVSLNDLTHIKRYLIHDIEKF